MKVFISYSPSDQEWATAIGDGLAAAGYEPWLFTDAIMPGQNWAEHVGKALSAANAMVVIFSEAWAKSPYLQWELAFALGSDRFEGRLIPVIVGDPAKVQLPAAVRYLSPMHAGKSVGPIVKRIVENLGRARKAG